MKMKLLFAFNFFLICTDISLITGQQTPICVVRFEEDTVLHIETLETARKLNFPHSSWALCNDNIDEYEKNRNTSETVSKNALTVIQELKEEDSLPECKHIVTPAVVQNKQNKKILEVGYEIYNSKLLIGDIDLSQSNENVQAFSQKVAIIEKIEKLRSSTIMESHWISVLSIMNNESTWYSDYTTKRITYEILNADNPSEVITCPYFVLDSHTELFEKNGSELKDIEKPMLGNDPEYSNDITVELLVPTKHLNSYGRQLTACVHLNMLPMWSKISQTSWTKTNDFIMHVAEVLGRLQITAGTTGVFQIKNSKGPIILKFADTTLDLKMPKIMWRIVKYTLSSPRYGTETDFGIVIITHTDDIKEHTDGRICPSICRENGWKVESVIELGLTYCCPVDIDVLNKLKIEDTVSPMPRVFNFNEIRKMKTSYEKFNESFLI